MIERDAIEHELKCVPGYFDHVLDGSKPFEIRKNDRDFRAGDSLYLREFEPSGQQYTGRSYRAKVLAVFHPSVHIPLPEGYVALGLEVIPPSGVVWRCYHCAAQFTGKELLAARLHFGLTSEALPACVQDALRRAGVRYVVGNDEDNSGHAIVFDLAHDRPDAERVLRLLNEAFSLDPIATHVLLTFKAHCNLFLAEHPTIEVGKCTRHGERQHPDPYEFSALGLLNGLVPREQGRVAAMLDSSTGLIVGFKIVTDAEVRT